MLPLPQLVVVLVTDYLGDSCRLYASPAVWETHFTLWLRSTKVLFAAWKSSRLCRSGTSHRTPFPRHLSDLDPFQTLWLCWQNGLPATEVL